MPDSEEPGTEYGPEIAVTPSLGLEFAAVLLAVMVSAVESLVDNGGGEEEL